MQEITKREDLFGRIFKITEALHLYYRGTLLPTRMIVAPVVFDANDRIPVVIHDVRLTGEDFFRFLVRSGRVTNQELGKFFPNKGSVFDMFSGRVSRKHRHDSTWTEVPDQWPCFNQNPEAFAHFVRRFVKKEILVFNCLVRSFYPVWIVHPDGALDVRNGEIASRFGLGR